MIAMLQVLAQSAQSGGGAGDIQWIGLLLNSGPFAIVVYLILSNKLITPGERDRLIAEVKAAQDREQKLNDYVRTEIVPLITRSTEASARNTEALEHTMRILENGDTAGKSG